jgi:hypothetical protein
MAEHPIVGSILFGSGLVLVAAGYGAPDPLPLLLLGHIFSFNGALWGPFVVS